MSLTQNAFQQTHTHTAMRLCEFVHILFYERLQCCNWCSLVEWLWRLHSLTAHSVPFSFSTLIWSSENARHSFIHFNRRHICKSPTATKTATTTTTTITLLWLLLLYSTYYIQTYIRTVEHRTRTRTFAEYMISLAMSEMKIYSTKYCMNSDDWMKPRKKVSDCLIHFSVCSSRVRCTTRHYSSSNPRFSQ